ncbi:MAG: VWA domain-containing protein [Acidobacteriota bacterium]
MTAPAQLSPQTRRLSSRRWRLGAAGLLLALLTPVAVGAASKSLEPQLPRIYEDWLASVAQLMTPRERAAFEELDDDLGRESFIHHFWLAREDATDDRLSPAARWHLNYEDARERFDSLEEDRAQALILAGRPASVLVFAGCEPVIRPLRIWTYGPWHAVTERDEDFYLVFYRASRDGPFRLWSPSEGTAPIMYQGPARKGAWPVEELIDYAKAKNCFRWEPSEAIPFATALRSASGLDELRQMTLPEPPLDWLDAWRSRPVDVGAGLPAELSELTFPGRYQSKTIVRGRVAIPTEEVARNAAGQLVDRITVVGDVWLGDRLVDSFHIVHLVAGTPAKAVVQLDFYRRLRPGTYRLDLRVEDAFGRGLLRSEQPLKVPRLEQPAPSPPGHRLGLPGLTRREVGMLTTFPSVEILAPQGNHLVGEVELAAVTTGGPIEHLEFQLDGVTVSRDETPPYSATLPLPTQPQPQRVVAIAVDPEDREIARDSIILNSGPQRLAVRWLEPATDTGEPTALAVEVPSGDTLAQIDIYLNQHHAATLREPPYTFELPAVRPFSTTYARAVAITTSGAVTEDLIFLAAPENREEIDVRLVELYTSVTDNQGRFVTGLTAEDFQVEEDGQVQVIQRFDTVEHLAINVALLMDVSMSMRKKLDIATRSAQRFFETVLTPKDQASLLSFNHDVRRVVGFTNDVDDLRYGVDGFRAWGTSRLHDGLIYTVHSFGGLQGKRALVLLSDGQDVDSDFTFKQVLEQTLRSAVAVYPIALGIDHQLGRLALESGGRLFLIGGVEQLDAIYRLIEEELRSQYLLVYEPPANGRRDFRRVEVKVLKPGLKARSIHGYYP